MTGQGHIVDGTVGVDRLFQIVQGETGIQQCIEDTLQVESGIVAHVVAAHINIGVAGIDDGLCNGDRKLLCLEASGQGRYLQHDGIVAVCIFHGDECCAADRAFLYQTVIQACDKVHKVLTGQVNGLATDGAAVHQEQLLIHGQCVFHGSVVGIDHFTVDDVTVAEAFVAAGRQVDLAAFNSEAADGANAFHDDIHFLHGISEVQNQILAYYIPYLGPCSSGVVIEALVDGQSAVHFCQSIQHSLNVGCIQHLTVLEHQCEGIHNAAVNKYIDGHRASVIGLLAADHSSLDLGNAAVHFVSRSILNSSDQYGQLLVGSSSGDGCIGSQHGEGIQILTHTCYHVVLIAIVQVFQQGFQVRSCIQEIVHAVPELLKLIDKGFVVAACVVPYQTVLFIGLQVFVQVHLLGLGVVALVDQHPQSGLAFGGQGITLQQQFQSVDVGCQLLQAALHAGQLVHDFLLLLGLCCQNAGQVEDVQQLCVIDNAVQRKGIFHFHAVVLGGIEAAHAQNKVGNGVSLTVDQIVSPCGHPRHTLNTGVLGNGADGSGAVQIALQGNSAIHNRVADCQNAGIQCFAGQNGSSLAADCVGNCFAPCNIVPCFALRTNHLGIAHNSVNSALTVELAVDLIVVNLLVIVVLGQSHVVAVRHRGRQSIHTADGVVLGRIDNGDLHVLIQNVGILHALNGVGVEAVTNLVSLFPACQRICNHAGLLNGIPHYIESHALVQCNKRGLVADQCFQRIAVDAVALHHICHYLDNDILAVHVDLNGCRVSQQLFNNGHFCCSVRQILGQSIQSGELCCIHICNEGIAAQNCHRLCGYSLQAGKLHSAVIHTVEHIVDALVELFQICLFNAHLDAHTAGHIHHGQNNILFCQDLLQIAYGLLGLNQQLLAVLHQILGLAGCSAVISQHHKQIQIAAVVHHLVMQRLHRGRLHLIRSPSTGVIESQAGNGGSKTLNPRHQACNHILQQYSGGDIHALRLSIQQAFQLCQLIQSIQALFQVSTDLEQLLLLGLRNMNMQFICNLNRVGVPLHLERAHILAGIFFQGNRLIVLTADNCCFLGVPHKLLMCKGLCGNGLALGINRHQIILSGRLHLIVISLLAEQAGFQQGLLTIAKRVILCEQFAVRDGFCFCGICLGQLQNAGVEAGKQHQYRQQHRQVAFAIFLHPNHLSFLLIQTSIPFRYGIWGQYPQFYPKILFIVYHH